MIVLYESYLSKDGVTKYHNKGYRVASVFDNPVIKQGESVGFILTTLYKKSIDLIDDLLYHKHCVTLSYNGKTYTLHNYIEWKHTYQNEKDHNYWKKLQIIINNTMQSDSCHNKTV